MTGALCRSFSQTLSEVSITVVLHNGSFDAFIDQATSYLAATDDSVYLLLVDTDDAVRRRGVANCWTLGQHDTTPLVLLRHIMPSLEGRSFLSALNVLAHATSHPDVL